MFPWQIFHCLLRQMEADQVLNVDVSMEMLISLLLITESSVFNLVLFFKKNNNKGVRNMK